MQNGPVIVYIESIYSIVLQQSNIGEDVPFNIIYIGIHLSDDKACMGPRLDANTFRGVPALSHGVCNILHIEMSSHRFTL